jgi:flavodoxin
VKATVVYESRCGNTAHIAHAISARLGATGTVQLVEAADPSAFDLESVDLIVVGGPTEGHGISVALRQRLAQVPAGALTGLMAAAFDTRLDWPAFLAGSAAKGIAEALRKKGARLVATPERFLGAGTKEFRLHEGELERADAWAAQIAEKVTAMRTVPAHDASISATAVRA